MITFLLASALMVQPSHGARLPAPSATHRAVPHKAGASAHKARPKAVMTAAPETSPAVASFSPDDPLGPAAAGFVQCYAPDERRKTCDSISTYHDNGDGSFANITAILINPKPVLVLQTITAMNVVSGAVCGQIRPEDIAAGTLTLSGKGMAAADAAPILGKVSTAMSGLYGKQICTTYEPNASGKGLTAHVSVDGVASPDQDNQVMWVGAKEGYKVSS